MRKTQTPAMRRWIQRFWPVYFCLFTYAVSAWHLHGILPAQPLYTLPDHEGLIEFSPCERWLLTVVHEDANAASPRVRVRETLTGRVVQTMTMHAPRDWGTTGFSQDGDWLVTQDKAGLLYVWKVMTGELIWTGRVTGQPKDYANDCGLELSTHGRWMWVREEGKPNGEVREGPGGPARLSLPAESLHCFSPNERYFATAISVARIGQDDLVPQSQIVVWDMNEFPPHSLKLPQIDRYTQVTICDTEVAAGSIPGLFRRWSLPDGQSLPSIPSISDALTGREIYLRYLQAGFLEIREGLGRPYIWDLNSSPPTLLTEPGSHSHRFSSASGWRVDKDFLGEEGTPTCLRAVRSNRRRSIPSSELPNVFISEFSHKGSMLLLEENPDGEGCLPDFVYSLCFRIGLTPPRVDCGVKLRVYDIAADRMIGAPLIHPGYTGDEPGQWHILSPDAQWLACWGRYRHPGTEIYGVPFKPSLAWTLLLPIVPTGILGVAVGAGYRWRRHRRQS